METRIIVAYALIALLAAFAASAGWHWLTRESRQKRKRRRHEQTMRERWLTPVERSDAP
jgi:hypothetical protein